MKKKCCIIVIYMQLFCMADTKDMKKRLAAVGKDRKWLAEVTGYSHSSVMHAMSARSPNKSAKIMHAIDAAISNEEKAQGRQSVEETGFFTLEFTPQEFRQIDRASRIVNAPSIKDYCQDAVKVRTKEIIARGQIEDRSLPLASHDKKRYNASTEL
ncbi:hypothetical protein EBZ39_09695 [bacterium]|nr:hypothetical protein [bacterium]